MTEGQGTRTLPPLFTFLLSSPGSTAANVGQQQTLNLQANDETGSGVASLPVTFVISGPNGQTLTAVTDSTGHASINYGGLAPGTDSVQVAGNIGGTQVVSNAVNILWTAQSGTSTWPSAPSSGSTISITVSAPTTVTLPNQLPLTATVTDSTQNATITVNWTEVSGPGPATFSNPQQVVTQQAVTNASFLEPGNYVLQISVTDSANNSNSLQIPITVYPMVPVEGGGSWIGSPADGASVSGAVPIILAQGVTLASGTLSYSPTTDNSQVTVISSTINGSGQVATFDTTTLPDGSYWLQLQGTDSNGNSQNNLAMVTVVGDYKPGRVTTTVTDFTVPAPVMPIQIGRTYDSLNRNQVGDFGYGWNLSTSVGLVVDSKNNVTFTINGQRRTFYFTPTTVSPFVPVDIPDYTPEQGFHGTLKASGPGCWLDGMNFWDVMIQVNNLWVCDWGGGVYNPPGYIYTDPYGRSYTISSNGNLQSIMDLNGNGLTITANGITSTKGLSVPFVRDSQGRITQITDPQGNQYQYNYDPQSGDLTSVNFPSPLPGGSPLKGQYKYDPTFAHLYAGGTDTKGNALPSTTYYPDGDPNAGKLQSVTVAPDGTHSYTTSYAYDLTTNTTTTTYPADASGNVGTATQVYDSYGMLLSSTDPNGNTTTNVYDANHNLTSTTDPLGHTTSYTYNANGSQASKTYPKTATSVKTTSLMVYDEHEQLLGTMDELGNQVAYSYDANFWPQYIVDFMNDQPTVRASFNFNADGTLASGAIGYDIATAPNMAVQYTYDTYGNMASKTDPLGRQTAYQYNNLGQQQSMTAPLPNPSTSPSSVTTAYQYDAFSNLIKTSAPLNRTTSSTYDSNDNKTSDTDANGNVTNYQYDALNRLIEIDYPTQPPTKLTRTYDFRGNILNETDQAGNVTHNDYDLGGRLIAVTKAYGTSNASKTSYTYNADGTKQTQTDPNGNTTTYTYDAAGRLITVANAVGNQTQYGYDDAGNQTSITDPNGHKTQFQYDARKRLVKTIYPDQTSTTNTYDNPGNLIAVVDQAGNEVDYTYDADNELQSVIQKNHPDPAHNTTAYTYDGAGNLIASTDDNGHTTASGFDFLSQLLTTTLPDGSLTETRNYDAAGNLLGLLDFNGKTTTYQYDPLNRLTTRIPDGSSGDVAESFTYTSTGKRASMTDASGLTTYTYDHLDRLLSKATPQGTLSYTYDSAGNVASIASSNPNGVSVQYSYDQLNRLATVVDARLPSGQNVTAYTYDAANNLATVNYPNGVASSFAYDSLNRMTGAGLASQRLFNGELQLHARGQRAIAWLRRNPAGAWSTGVTTASTA